MAICYFRFRVVSLSSLRILPLSLPSLSLGVWSYWLDTHLVPTALFRFADQAAELDDKGSQAHRKRRKGSQDTYLYLEGLQYRHSRIDPWHLGYRGPEMIPTLGKTLPTVAQIVTDGQ